jgi:phosphonate transport system substrate-binding protein
MMTDEPPSKLIGTRTDPKRRENGEDNAGVSHRASPSRPSRRQYLQGAVTANTIVATGLSGCLNAVMGGTNDSSTETVTWILTPSEQPEAIKKQYAPVKKYLEDRVNGITVEMPVATNYSAILPALESGRAEIAMDDVTLISHPDLLDVFGTIVTEGTPWYFSMILTLPTYDIDTLTDLKGTLISFCDPISTSGSIYPLYALKQAGLNIGDAPKGKPIDFRGTWSSHDQSFKTMINRKEVKANANSGNFGIPHLSKKELPRRVKEKSAYYDEVGTKEPPVTALWISKPIPKQPITVRSNWKSDKRDEIRTALAEATVKDFKQYETPDVEIAFTGMKTTSIETYQPVIRRVEGLGIDLR